MNAKTKSILILLSALILGILLGIVIDRTIIEYQMRQRFFRFARPGMERMILERIIQPTQEQKAQIGFILQKYGEKFRTLRFNTRKETRALMDSMRQEIDPILTKKQKEEIWKNMERLMRMGPRHRPRFGREHWRDFSGTPPEEPPEQPPIPPK